MSAILLGLLVGLAFGASLYLSDLANPDKIIGTLRLRDLHAMRVIGVFIVTGILGVWLLDLAGLANYSVKAAAWLAVGLGGALVGAGFGMTGYCPGTGLAAAASGRVDAAFAVLGMFAGTAAYIATYSIIAEPIIAMANQGKVTLQEVTPIPQAVWALGLGGAGAAALWLTRNIGKGRPVAARREGERPTPHGLGVAAR